MHTDRKAFRRNKNTPEEKAGKMLTTKFSDCFIFSFYFSTIKNEKGRQNTTAPLSIQEFLSPSLTKKNKDLNSSHTLCIYVNVAQR